MTDKPAPPTDPPKEPPAEVTETDPEMMRVLFDHEMERGATTTRIVRNKRRLRPLPRQ